MVRRLTPLILLVAVLIAAQPLLHSHPLQSSVSGPSESTVCAICATSVGRVTTVAVLVGAPQVLDRTHVSVALPSVAADAPLPRSPRAPPAA